MILLARIECACFAVSASELACARSPPAADELDRALSEAVAEPAPPVTAPEAVDEPRGAVDIVDESLDAAAEPLGVAVEEPLDAVDESRGVVVDERLPLVFGEAAPVPGETDPP